MGLITKEIEITISHNMIKYYEGLGYVIPTKELSEKYKRKRGKDKVYDLEKTIIVQVKDLPESSNQKVLCQCDYCGKQKRIKYSDYQKSIKHAVAKYACKDCAYLKTAECNMINWGVKSPTQLPEVMKKIQDTMTERYGKPSYLQTEAGKAKMKNTNLERYGYECSLCNPEIKEKSIISNLEHYGVENPLQSEEIQKKIKQANMQKYGYEYPMQSPEFREKINRIMIEKYGYASVLESPEYQEKIRNTISQKYGTENIGQNEEIKQRIKTTMNARYGVNYPSQSPEIRSKMVDSFYKNQSVATSKQQKYLGELYNMEINYPILCYNVDLCDAEEKIIIGYDGGGHWLSVELGKLTQEEFDRRQMIKELQLKDAGYKIIRIISIHDKLPSDEILFQMLSDAKLYFKNFPQHTWINFDIDNGIYRNAEHKDGSPYFYGQLRKIKSTDLQSA